MEQGWSGARIVTYDNDSVLCSVLLDSVAVRKFGREHQVYGGTD